MDTEVVALAIIMFVAIGVSIGILTSVNSEAFGSPGDKIKEVFQSVADSIMPGKSYDICEESNNKIVSQKDFEVLLQAMSKGECTSNSTTIQLSFSLTKKDFDNMTKGLDIANSGENVFYRSDIATLGIGAVIVHGNPGYYPLKMWDKVRLDFAGQPEKDIVISVDDEGCDPYDQNCEIMCSYMGGICDLLCYRDNDKEDVSCDIDCVDTDQSGNITSADRDGICDRDCYTNHLAPDRAYDPDCIWKNKASNDTICDPNTNGVQDGLCDPDCAVNSTVCDPDCNGMESEGNPSGLLSPACYICDKTCNGFCSMACVKDDKDPDCPDGFGGFDNLTACCGNGKCENEDSENCKLCDQDCPSAGASCEDFGKVCCPSSVAIGSDEFGCSGLTGVIEGGSCDCSSQCQIEMTCSSGRCCPVGSMWSIADNKCINRTDVLIVALKSKLTAAYPSDITRIESKIEEYRAALGQDGLGSQFLYLDDASTTGSITPGGKYVTSPDSSTDIRATLSPLLKKLNSTYLVIIGGDGRFVQAPVGSSTGSDVVYGDTNGDNIGDVAVGRFPDPKQGDINVILNALDTAIKLHKNGGIDLVSHVAPIMSAACGGPDGGDWSSGKCFCKAIYGSDCQACSSCCGKIGPSGVSGKNFVVILAHGPGPEKQDLLYGGGFVVSGTNFMGSIDVKDSMWMLMSCGGGHLKLKQTTSDSIAMTFLKNGGALFVGSTNNNYGNQGGCSVPGGDRVIGTLYVDISKNLKTGVRVGDAYTKGKNAFYTSNPGGQYVSYTYYINCLYGDPTLKIKSIWSSA